MKNIMKVAQCILNIKAEKDPITDVIDVAFEVPIDEIALLANRSVKYTSILELFIRVAPKFLLGTHRSGPNLKNKACLRPQRKYPMKHTKSNLRLSIYWN